MAESVVSTRGEARITSLPSKRLQAAWRGGGGYYGGDVSNGGPGGYAKKTLTVTPGSTLSLRIGTAGSGCGGSAASNGDNNYNGGLGSTSKAGNGSNGNSPSSPSGSGGTGGKPSSGGNGGSGKWGGGGACLGDGVKTGNNASPHVPSSLPGNLKLPSDRAQGASSSDDCSAGGAGYAILEWK